MLLKVFSLNNIGSQILRVGVVLGLSTVTISGANASTILLQADFNDLVTPETEDPRMRFSTIVGEETPLGNSGFTILSGSVNALDETFELVPGSQIAPGQGKIVDVAGEPPEGGAITSSTFSFQAGDSFELEFKLFPWQDSFFGESARMRVSFGDLFDEIFTLRFDDPMQTITRSFEASFDGEANLIFDPRNQGNPRVDVAPFIDDVILTQTRVPEPSSLASLGILAGLGLLKWRYFSKH